MRKELGIAKLVRLNDTSKDWAEVMATTGLFEHANINAPKSGKYSAEYASRKMYSIGENILINATSA